MHTTWYYGILPVYELQLIIFSYPEAPKGIIFYVYSRNTIDDRAHQTSTHKSIDCNIQ